MRDVFTLVLLWGPLAERDFSKWEVPDWGKKQAQAWKAMFSGPVTSPRFFHWLYFLSPQPASAFRPFTEERINSGLLGHTADWSRMFFQEIANPAARRHRVYSYQIVPNEEAERIRNAAGQLKPLSIEPCGVVETHREGCLLPTSQSRFHLRSAD